MLTQPTVEHMQSLGLVEMARAAGAERDPRPRSSASMSASRCFVDAQYLHNSNKRIARLLSEAVTTATSLRRRRRRARPPALATALHRPFHRRQKGILIVGATGTGKTYLACAPGQQACRQGRRVRYYRTSRLLEELAIARRRQLSKDPGPHRPLRPLILDDFLMVPRPNRSGATCLKCSKTAPATARRSAPASSPSTPGTPSSATRLWPTHFLDRPSLPPTASC